MRSAIAAVAFTAVALFSGVSADAQSILSDASSTIASAASDASEAAAPAETSEAPKISLFKVCRF